MVIIFASLPFDFDRHFQRWPKGVDPEWLDGKVMKTVLSEIEKLKRAGYGQTEKQAIISLIVGNNYVTF